MLHRSRQTHTEASRRPFILVGSDRPALEEALGELGAAVILKEYLPEQRFRKYAQGDRWIAAMQELLGDLSKFFPYGVPKMLFEALPKHLVGEKGSSKKVVAARRQLQVLAQHLQHDQHFRNLPLGQALLALPSWRYHNLKPRGSGNDRTLQEAVLNRCGLTGARTGGGTAPTVFVDRQLGEAERAAAYDQALQHYRLFLAADTSETMDALIAGMSWFEV